MISQVGFLCVWRKEGEMDGIQPVTNFFFSSANIYDWYIYMRYDSMTIDYGLSLGVLSLSLRCLRSQVPSLCFPSFYLLD